MQVTPSPTMGGHGILRADDAASGAAASRAGIRHAKVRSAHEFRVLDNGSIATPAMGVMKALQRRSAAGKAPHNADLADITNGATVMEEGNPAMAETAQEAISQQDCPRPNSIAYSRQLHTLRRKCVKMIRPLTERMAATEADSVRRTDYANTRLALQRLIQALRKAELGTPQPAAAGSDEEGCGGMLAVDLDEAIHGLYTAVAYMNKAGANGFDALGASLAQDAKLWVREPQKWLMQGAMPHGAADIGITAGVAVALVPFALLALHAGLREIDHARATYQTVKTTREDKRKLHCAIEDALSALKLLPGDACPGSGAGRWLVAMRDICTQEMEHLYRAMKYCRLNDRIGHASALSGGVIAVKATADLGAKVTYLATGASAFGAGAATIVGATGTIALAPAAALGAVGLGAAMAVKSNRVALWFKGVNRLTRNHMGSMAIPPKAQKQVAAYQQFVGIKLDQRKLFVNSYAKDNRRFLAGSALYATSAIVTSGLTLLALFAAGIAIGPVGLGAIMVAGVIGGLVMGRYSAQFLIGHGRQQRYENYAITDDAELDRQFIGRIDAFSARQPGIPASAGIELRAHFFEQAGQRDRLRQAFLSDVAAQSKKRFDGACVHSTDKPVLAGIVDGPPGKLAFVKTTLRNQWQTAGTRAIAAKTYCSSLYFWRKHWIAKASANQARLAAKPYLDVVAMQDWLRRPANRLAQIAMMLDSTAVQIDYMEKKTALRLDMYALGNDLSPQLCDDALSPEEQRRIFSEADKGDVANADLAAVLDRIAEPLAKDVLLLEQARLLGQALQMAAETPASDDASEAADAILAAIVSRFVVLQRGEVHYELGIEPTLGQAHTVLAEYCLKEAPQRHRNLRGLLIDVEMEAGDMAQRIKALQGKIGDLDQTKW